MADQRTNSLCIVHQAACSPAEEHPPDESEADQTGSCRVVAQVPSSVSDLASRVGVETAAEACLKDSKFH